MCDIITFTWRARPSLLEETGHEVREFQEVRDPQYRPTAIHGDLWLGCDEIGPLRRHRADMLLVDPQQESCTVAVEPLADTHHLLSAERMERMGHAYKA